MRNSERSLVKRFMLTGLAVSMLMLAASAYAWIRLPAGAELPIHWNLAGEVDGTTGKAGGLLLLPAISMVLFLVLALLPKIDPRKSNIDQSTKAYLATGFAFGGVMLLVHLLVVAASLGFNFNVTVVLTAVLGIVFIVIGNFMGKIRSNFMFGVRTPWTLSSDLSWNKTHRLAGKLLMAWGMIVLLLTFTVGPDHLLIYAVGGLLGVTAFSCVYSYLVWRKDPATPSA